MSAVSLFFGHFFRCINACVKNCHVCKSLDVDPETAVATPGSQNTPSVNIIIIIYPSGDEPTRSFLEGRKKVKKNLEDDWTFGHTGQIHNGQFNLIATARSVQTALAFPFYLIPLRQT